MLHICNSDFVKTEDGAKQLKMDTTDLIAQNEVYNHIYSMWVPLQETIANAYLLTLKKGTEDMKLREVISDLIVANSSKMKLVKDLTSLSECILDNLGTKKGWQLLAGMAMYASSIKTYHPKEEPKTFESLKKLKEQVIKEGIAAASKDPAFNNPTARFIEMIEVAVNSIDKVKKAISRRGVDPNDMALRIANICGHEVDLIEDQTAYFIECFNALSTNEKLMPDRMRRALHAQGEKFLKILKDITKQEFPTFWFLSDKKSGKIYSCKHRITDKHKELENYMHLNILKYQYLKSMKEGKDLINCFENNASFCSSDCKECVKHPGLQKAKKLYQETKDFPYDELMKEGLSPERLKRAIHN